MIKWISVKKKLPKNKQEVLIYTNEKNVISYGKLQRTHVANFVRGRTAEEVKRSGYSEACDQSGNNLVPYFWEGDGPCSWFGQEVTHWAELNKP